jgi:hypothetical protein
VLRVAPYLNPIYLQFSRNVDIYLSHRAQLAHQI